MHSLANKVALIFLFLVCSKPHTYIQCLANRNSEIIKRGKSTDDTVAQIFAEVQKIIKEEEQKGTKLKTQFLVRRKLPPVCGAAWIDKDFLITAASCLDEEKLTATVKERLTTLYDVEVRPMEIYEETEPQGGSSSKFYGKGKTFYTAKAILHPLFRRSKEISKGMPIGVDVAVVTVNLNVGELLGKVPVVNINHKNGFICKPEDVGETWTAIGLDVIGSDATGTWAGVHTWNLTEFASTDDKDVAVFEDKEFYIHPDQQFTTFVNDDIPYLQKLQGVPILTSKGSSKRCIAGITNFSGRKDGKLFITSTKLYTGDTEEWVDHAKGILKQTLVPKLEKKGKFGSKQMENLYQKSLTNPKTQHTPGSLVKKQG